MKAPLNVVVWMAINFQMDENALVSMSGVDIILWLIFSSLLFIDENECESGAHSCAQLCVNTEGSYTCACNDGFTLTSDGESCTGPLLIFLLRGSFNRELFLMQISMSVVF